MAKASIVLLFVIFFLIFGAVARRCSIEKVFLEISQNSQENNCQSVFFNKVAALALAWNFIKKDTLAQVFSCEFLRTPIL